MRNLPDDFLARRGARLFAAPPPPYRICVRCVMDTSDREIRFDERGVCNHCASFDQAVKYNVFPGELGQQMLAEAVARMKRAGAGRRYDCLIGLSGGVDSTYTAYVVKKLGLRPLAMHLDNGWNSETAVRNIENLVTTLGIDLHTEVLDWVEFRELQLAFLRASTPDSEVPTDHAIIATLYRVARRQGIRWIAEGSNIVTEVMVPQTWSRGHGDWKYIRSLNERFGTRPLRTFPHYTFFDRTIVQPRFSPVQRFAILNYIDYNKPRAMELMRRELGWEYYGGKHYESVYTRFYQGYILTGKFGFDKRRSHLSCLANNGSITRDEALRELEKPAIDPVQLREDRAFVIKKLGISEEEFVRIMELPRKTFWDYPSYEADIASGARGTETYWVMRLAALLDWTAALPACLSAVLNLPRRVWSYLKRRASALRRGT